MNRTVTAGGWRLATGPIPGVTEDMVIGSDGWVVPRPATREDLRHEIEKLRAELLAKPSPSSPLDAIADALAQRIGGRLPPAPPPQSQAPEGDARSVSIPEAARILAVSERTVARGVADGTIPSMKVRGRRVIQVGKLLRENSDEEIARRAREILRGR